MDWKRLNYTVKVTVTWYDQVIIEMFIQYSIGHIRDPVYKCLRFSKRKEIFYLDRDSNPCPLGMFRTLWQIELLTLFKTLFYFFTDPISREGRHWFFALCCSCNFTHFACLPTRRCIGKCNLQNIKKKLLVFENDSLDYLEPKNRNIKTWIWYCNNRSFLPKIGE